MFQLGTTTETEFDGLVTQKFEVGISYLANVSILVSLKTELKQINRKTDSFFDWLGDWGGLQDGLSLLVEIFLHIH